MHNFTNMFPEEECDTSSLPNSTTASALRPVALAINNHSNMCCVILSKASFAMLKSNFDMFKTESDATNWNGCDEINRTLSIKSIKLTGRYFHKKLDFYGRDSDMGHSYPWTFHADILAEVLPV